MLQELLEFLSPSACVVCNKQGSWLCRACNLSLTLPAEQFCPGCLTPSPGGLTCTACADLSVPLNQLISCYAYEAREFHRVLAAYKEDGNAHLHVPLGRRLQDVLGDVLPPNKKPIVVPIPCSVRRRRARGFDQAELLARYVASRCSLVLDPSVLVRVKQSGTQKNLGVLERRRALRGTYRVTSDALKREACQKNGVLLVDDVATSLATLETCALALRRAGTTEIRALVLAHAALT